MSHSETFDLLFLRHESEGVTNMAFVNVTLTSVDPSQPLQLQALGRINKAISKWIEETEAGRQAWEQTQEDLNIGDLANYDFHRDPELALNLSLEGVTIHKITTLGDIPSINFDEVLASPSL